MAGSDRRAQLLLDALTAGVFGLIAIPFSLAVGVTVDAAWPLVTVVAATMTVAVGFARRAPGTALTIAASAAIGQMALGLPPVPADLAVLGVLFATGADERRWLRIAGLSAAIAGAVAAAAYLVLPMWLGGALVSLTYGVLVLVAGLVTFILAWTFGVVSRIARRSRRERDATVAAQLEAIAEQERGRIVRDMHDVVAHSLTVMVAQADGARYLTPDRTERTEEALATIAAVGREALGDVRVLLHGLRYPQGTMPQPGLGELLGLVEQVREAGLVVETDAGRAPDNVSAATQLALYRITQESLTNVLRHGTGPVQLRLAWDADWVRLLIRSPLLEQHGQLEQSAGRGAHGLLGMRERARLAGGTLRAERDGREFVVSAALPLIAGERAQ